jgi:hypothetical protein
MKLSVVPPISDDSVGMGVRPGEKRGVAGAGDSRGVVVPTIYEVGSLKQKVKATVDKLRPESNQVLIPKLVDDQDND